MCAWESLLGLVVRMGWNGVFISNESKNTRSFAILRSSISILQMGIKLALVNLWAEGREENLKKRDL
jgi:hypothetical protein